MILHIHVKPNARENSLEKVGENEYRAEIKSPADKNKANLELVKLLAKTFNVSTRQISIKNPTSRKKIIEIKG